MYGYQILSVDSLAPYERNARTHSDEQIEQLRKSIREFGFTNPLLVDERNGIIAGHGRLQAARLEGMTEVPCIEVTGLTPEQHRALVIADNQLALKAGWDFDVLAAELDALNDAGFDMALTGFSQAEIDDLIGSAEIPGNDPESTPAAPETPVTVAGDVWLLGTHRVMCGDSTSLDAVELLMAGDKADLVLTDPPYNIASDSANFAADVREKSYGALKAAEWDQGFDPLDSVASIMAVCADNVTVYVFTSHFLFGQLIAAFKEWADFTSYLVWSKPNPMPSLSKRHPTWNTELCLYATRGSKRSVNFPQGQHFLSCRDVVRTTDGTHPTQKPIDLLEPLVCFSSNEGQIVLDLFGGSGSTLIAAAKTGRVCRMMEMQPKYVDVIVNRWEQFTGKTAKLEATGRTFADLKAERHGQTSTQAD